MIVHTLIFSFGEGRTQAEQDKFLATVTDISLKSGLCTRVETRKHLPLPNDAYAQYSSRRRSRSCSARASMPSR